MNLRWGIARLAPFLLFAAAVAGEPAEARGWPFGSDAGSSSAIERLHDLPDNQTFKRNGAYWDLGYVYEKTESFGIFGSSSGQDGFFALYHGTDYVKLDEAGKARVIDLVGFDPTSGYVPREDGYRAGTPATIASDGDGPADDGHARRGLLFGPLGFAGLAFFLLTIGYRVLFNARRATAGVAGIARTLVRAGSSEDEPTTAEQLGSDRHLTFDQRVAARLAELEQARHGGANPGGPEPGDGPDVQLCPNLSATSGFGRKTG